MATVWVLPGCDSSPKPVDFRPAARRSLTATQPVAVGDRYEFTQFAVTARPPAGWTLKTTSVDDRHEHMTWISPTDRTAFGIVYFKLPWPVGHELAFRYGFLAEMRKREGEGEVLEKYWDPAIEGLRFTVNSKNYQVQAKFLVRGMRGFATYSGARRAFPAESTELEQARAARESAEFAGEVTAPPTTGPANADTRD